MGRLFTLLLRVFTLLVIFGMCLSRSIVEENIPDQNVRVTNKPRHHLARMMSNSNTRNTNVAAAQSKTTTSHGFPVGFSVDLSNSTPTIKPSNGSTWDDMRVFDRLLYHLLRPKTPSNITNAVLAVTTNNVTHTPLNFPKKSGSMPADKPSNSFRWHGMRVTRKIRYQLIRTMTKSYKTNAVVAVTPNNVTPAPLKFTPSESKHVDQPSNESKWHDMRVIDELRYHLIRIMTQSNNTNAVLAVTPNNVTPAPLNFPENEPKLAGQPSNGTRWNDMRVINAFLYYLARAMTQSNNTNVGVTPKTVTHTSCSFSENERKPTHKPTDKPSNGTTWQITFAVSGEGIPAGLALTFIAVSLIVGVLFSPRRSWYSLIANRSRTIQTGSNVHRYISLIVGVLFSPRRSWYSLIANRSRTIQTGSNVHRYIADCGRSI